MSVFSLMYFLEIDESAYTSGGERTYETQKFFICAWFVVLRIYYKRGKSVDKINFLFCRISLNFWRLISSMCYCHSIDDRVFIINDTEVKSVDMCNLAPKHFFFLIWPSCPNGYSFIIPHS